MSQGSDESSADALNAALIAFTGCVGEALEDICSYGLTIGENYVPFDPDPEDDCDPDEAACSQVWVRVMDVGMAYETQGFGDSCGGVMTLNIEVGVLRCITIEEGGEAPTATDVMVAALQTMTDMKALYCAAMECDAWDSIDAGQWQPSGPLGGQYGGMWTFTVEV